MTLRLTAFALALAVCAACAHADEPAAPITPIEQLVFQDNHLRNIHPPTTLRYGFVQSGQPAPANDELVMTLNGRDGGGCCAVAAHGRPDGPLGVMPTVEDAEANPVILYFLERDIREMQQLTGGQSAYFRQRIRLTLAGPAVMVKTTIRYKGHEAAASEIRFSPYADDPRRERYGPLADKSYVLVLANDVPGGVYQLRTRAMKPSATGPTSEETVLTLEDRVSSP